MTRSLSIGGRLWSFCRKSTISTYRALVNGRHCTKTVNFFRAYFKINPTKDLNSNQKLGVKLKPRAHTHTHTHRLRIIRATDEETRYNER